MKKESVEFLKDLQHELNTQDNVGQAHPRFWVIMDYKWNVAADGCGERSALYCFDLKERSSIDVNDLGEELAEYIQDNELEDETNYFNDENTLEDLKEEEFDELETILHELGLEFQVNDESYEGFIASNTMFLTLRAAKEHLKANHYHYSKKAHAYAMTAWRSPQLEKLMDILMTEEFEVSE